jgi:hypothetical protein
MAEFLQEELTNQRGYVKRSGKPTASQIPLALTEDGQVVFGTNRIPLSTLQQLKLMNYDDEVERQRRLVADTALAQLALEHPRYVEAVVDRVGRAIKAYWLRLKVGASDATVKKIVADSNSRIYGTTSYGRRDPTLDSTTTSGTGGGEGATAKARIDLWFAPLDHTPRDVPKLMSLYDYFYCKVLDIAPDGRQSAENLRAELKKGTWRPSWYEQKGPRGRTDPSTTATTTSYPGLLSANFTIPMGGPLERCGLDLSDMLLDVRKRGWDMFSIQAGGMNDAFKQSLAQHNLPFSASASGTTSTLFLAAEAFAAISTFPLEEQKQYLLACVIYLVAGGMHTCHEVFWTGRQVGIPVVDGKYFEALPRSFTATRDYEKWSTEFWEIVRTDRTTVR